MCPVYGVRSVLYHHQASSLNQIGRPLSRSCDRYNAVCVTVNHKDWDVDTCRVVAEVFKPGLHTGNTGGGRGTRGNILARLDRLFADVLTQKNIRVVEILEKFGEERVSIRSHRFPDLLWDNKHGNTVAGVKMLIGAALGKTLDDSIEGKLDV